MMVSEIIANRKGKKSVGRNAFVLVGMLTAFSLGFPAASVLADPQPAGTVPSYVITITGLGEQETSRNDAGTAACHRGAAVTVLAVILGGSVANTLEAVADCTYAPSPDASCTARSDGVKGKCENSGMQSLGSPTCTGTYREEAIEAEDSAWGITCEFF